MEDGLSIKDHVALFTTEIMDLKSLDVKVDE